MEGSFRTHELRTTALDVPSGLGNFMLRECSLSTTTQFGGTGRRGEMLLGEQKRPFFSQTSLGTPSTSRLKTR